MPATRWSIFARKEIKMAYRFEECEYCAFHEVEPGICDECDEGSEYEPDAESEDAAVDTRIKKVTLFNLKEAA